MLSSTLALLTLLTAQSAPLSAQSPLVVPGGPGHFDFMNVDPYNRLVFACHPGKNSFTVVNLQTNTVKEVPLGFGVNGISADPKGKKVYAAGPGKTLVQVDMESWTKIASLALDGPGDSVIYDEKRGVVYVDNDDGTNLWIVDPKEMKILDAVTIKEAPEVMVYDDIRNRIFQNIKSSNSIQVIEPDSHSVVAELKLGTVTGPHGLVLDSSLGRLFSVGSNGQMAILNADNGQLVANVDVKVKSDQIAYDPSLKQLYIPGSGKLSVYKVSAKDATLVGTLPIPTSCHSVTVDPLSHGVWIAYADDKNSYVQCFLPN